MIQMTIEVQAIHLGGMRPLQILGPAHSVPHKPKKTIPTQSGARTAPQLLIAPLTHSFAGKPRYMICTRKKDYIQQLDLQPCPATPKKNKNLLNKQAKYGTARLSK
jgi:hypothetical protein